MELVVHNSHNKEEFAENPQSWRRNNKAVYIIVIIIIIVIITRNAVLLSLPPHEGCGGRGSNTRQKNNTIT